MANQYDWEKLITRLPAQAKQNLKERAVKDRMTLAVLVRKALEKAYPEEFR